MHPAGRAFRPPSPIKGERIAHPTRDSLRAALWLQPVQIAPQMVNFRRNYTSRTQRKGLGEHRSVPIMIIHKGVL